MSRTQTQQTLLDDAKLALMLAQSSLETLIPSSIRKEVAIARLARKLNPWGDAAEKYLGQGMLNEDGLRVHDLLGALEDLFFCLGRLDGAKARLVASAREPDLKLTRNRDR